MKHVLDLVLAGVVCCDDIELVLHALTKSRSCIMTSTPAAYGLSEDLRSNPAVVNPRTHDGSKVCGIRFENIYVLSDLSLREECVQEIVMAFNVCRRYGEGQFIVNERQVDDRTS